MDHHVRVDGALLDHCPLRGQVALQDAQAALLVEGSGGGGQHVGVPAVDPLEHLPPTLASDALQVQIQVALPQLSHDGGDAAGLIQLPQGVFAAGPDVGQLRCGPAGILEVILGELDPELAGDGGQMDCAVGGAADGHVHL